MFAQIMYVVIKLYRIRVYKMKVFIARERNVYDYIAVNAITTRNHFNKLNNTKQVGGIT